MLEIADIVGDEPVRVEKLAAQVQADPASLHRVRRVLASSGVFSEAAPGAFVSTPLSDGLRTDALLSVRHMAMFQGSDAYLAARQMLPRCRPGSADTVFGMSFFEHLASDPDRNARFHQAMGGGAAARAAAARDFDWSRVATVADIGGGNGSVLAGVLGAHEHLSGVVFDQPHVTILRNWTRGRRCAYAAENRLDPVMQRIVCVEHRGAVQQPDAADGLSQDRVVMRRGSQGADEREEGIAGDRAARALLMKMEMLPGERI